MLPGFTEGHYLKFMRTPIAFFIFRRPDTTLRVFDAIRKARPKQLFVVADGGRDSDEWKKCNEARTITEAVDWPCEVKRNYADKNLGCKIRVSSGLDWVFDNEEQAIILEDDTLPDQTFFPYAEELLERYKNDERIMHISGINFQRKNPKFLCEASYYFSHIPQIWGWASWRRAWKRYDVSIASWPEVKKSRLLFELFRDPAAADYWEYRFSEVYEKRNSTDPRETWDSQWAYACMVNRGLAINPNVNLVTNIGAGSAGTQMIGEKEGRLGNVPAGAIAFPLIHPAKTEVNEIADAFSLFYVWGINATLKKRIISFLKFRTPVLYKMLRRIYHVLIKQ